MVTSPAPLSSTQWNRRATWRLLSTTHKSTKVPIRSHFPIWRHARNSIRINLEYTTTADNPTGSLLSYQRSLVTHLYRILIAPPCYSTLPQLLIRKEKSTLKTRLVGGCWHTRLVGWMIFIQSSVSKIREAHWTIQIIVSPILALIVVYSSKALTLYYTKSVYISTIFSWSSYNNRALAHCHTYIEAIKKSLGSVNTRDFFSPVVVLSSTTRQEK